MQTLITIGYWNDGSDGCPFHNPQEFTSCSQDASLRESMFHYLRSGRPVAQFLGYSWCRFDCGIEDREMGGGELSDGVFLWPDGLAHYVACHQLILPNEFVEHARSNRFRSPVPFFEDDAEGDFDFWLGWCAANTNGDPDAQRLWRRTQDEVESADLEIMEKLIESHGGLSNNTCNWANCEAFALRGLAFCPACAHQKMNHWP